LKKRQWPKTQEDKMKQSLEGNPFEYSGDLLEAYIDNSVGVINLKNKVFEITTDIALKEAFFSKIRSAHLLPQIKVLLLLSGNSALGEENYARFIQSIVESTDGEMKHFREENALSQFIKLICGFEKIVVSGVRGSVIGSFLGAILSTDHRVASESTVFSFPHIRYETSPQGALAYFLPKYLSMAKAKNILLSGEPLSADKACELGLVDEVVADNIYEKKCIKIAGKMAQIPSSVVGMTKRLMEFDLKGLEAYFKKEAELTALNKIKLPSNLNRSKA
jgi:enoyl-CoA hydratase/carnithine racemase